MDRLLSKSQIETRSEIRAPIFKCRENSQEASGADDFEERKEKSFVDFTDDVGYRKGLSRMEQPNSMGGTPNL
jgi:uncharacterized protein YaiI (UPF0178 family)